MFSTAIIGMVLTIGFFALAAYTHKGVFLTLGITAMTICYHFTIRLVIGGLMELVPNENFNPRSPRFRELPFERSFYKSLKVRAWKQFVPTYDSDKFSIKNRALEDIARETCRAEAVHWLCVFASLASIFFAVRFGSLPAFLITGILGAAADMVFIILQRYNRPRLLRLIDKEKRL